MGSKSLWGDDIVSWYIVHQPNLVDLYNNSIVNHLPLYDFLLYFWIRILGNSEFILRSLSAVFAILTLPILYYFNKNFVSKFNSFFISFIYICYMTYTYNTQDVGRYSLYYLLAFSVLFCAVKLIEYPDRKKYFIPFSVSLFLILLTHIYSLFLLSSLFLIFIIFFFVEKNFSHLKIFFSIVIIDVLLVSPILLDYASLFTKRNGSLIDLVTIHTLIVFWYDLNYSSILLTLFGSIVFFPLLIVLYVHRSNKKIMFLTCFLILLVIQPLFLGFFIKIYQFHYFGYSIVLYTILLLFFLESFYKELTTLDVTKIHFNFIRKPLNFLKSRNISISSIILLVIILFQMYFAFYTVRSTVEFYNGPSIEDWKGINTYISSSIRPNDTILFYPQYFILSFDYYFKLNNTRSELDISNPVFQVSSLFNSTGGNSIFIVTWFKPYVDYNLNSTLHQFIYKQKYNFNEPTQFDGSYKGSRLIVLQLKENFSI